MAVNKSLLSYNGKWCGKKSCNELVKGREGGITEQREKGLCQQYNFE